MTRAPVWASLTKAEHDALAAVRRRPLTQGPIERRSETAATTHAEANEIDLIIDTNITRSTKA